MSFRLAITAGKEELFLKEDKCGEMLRLLFSKLKNQDFCSLEKVLLGKEILQLLNQICFRKNIDYIFYKLI